MSTTQSHGGKVHMRAVMQPQEYEAHTLAAADHDSLLAYLADMAQEMKDLADRSGAATLSGLFALAAAEAERQRKAR